MARKATANMPMTMKPAAMPMKPATMASMMGVSTTRKAAKKPAAKQGRRK
jgi:hypothetical protein